MVTKLEQIVPAKPMSGEWKKFNDARPYSVVSGFAFDKNGNFPILFRGPSVRSARNSWALPSGLAEVGFTMAEQFAIELKEELNLDADPTTCEHLGCYENILTGMDEGWHWKIDLLAIRVESLGSLRNAEPEKHTKVEICSSDLLQPWNLDLFLAKPWAPSLAVNWGKVADRARTYLRY